MNCEKVNDYDQGRDPTDEATYTSPFQQQEVLDFVDFLAQKQENYTFDRVLTRIRESDQTEDPAVLDDIIEEARVDFYKSKS